MENQYKQFEVTQASPYEVSEKEKKLHPLLNKERIACPTVVWREVRIASLNPHPDLLLAKEKELFQRSLKNQLDVILKEGELVF